MEYYDSLSKIITTLERIKKGFEEARQSGLAGQVLSAEILDTLLRMRIISSPSCLVYSPLLVQYLTDCTEWVVLSFSQPSLTYQLNERTVDVIHSKQQEQMWWKDSLWGRLTRFLRPRTSFEEATNGLAGLLTPLQLTFKAMQTTYEVRSKLIRRIEIKVEEHITKLEKDPSLARSVIRVAGMTGDDICQTLRHAQKALSFTGSRYDLEVRYLMLKIDILKQELAQKDPYSQNPPPYDARHPKNYTLIS
ncbi:hypothetical protein FRC02_002885 [Tulasnella sp. 418]|nr:hypothetical protein FRC02_002885 [Tulasnella sp. 418]